MQTEGRRKAEVVIYLHGYSVLLIGLLAVGCALLLRQQACHLLFR